MKLKYNLFLISILISGVGIAQEISSYVPAFATNIVIFNNGSLTAKTQEAGLENLEFYKEFKATSNGYLEGADADEELVPLLLSNLSDFGLDNVGKSIFFSRSRDSINYTAFVCGIANEEKLAVTIQTNLLNEESKTDALGKGYSYTFADNEVIAKNGKVVVFMKYNEPYYYGMFEEAVMEEELNEEYYESYEERAKGEEEKKQAKKQRIVESALDEIFSSDPNLSLAGSERFKKIINNTFDIAYYLDGSKSMLDKNFSAVMGFNRASSTNIDDLQSMFTDNYTWAYLNINENDIAIKSYSHVSDRWADNIKKMSKAKINKNLLKYVEGDNLIGYYGMAVKPEPMYDMTMDMYSRIFGNIPGYGEGVAAGVDIFRILLDEDEVFDFIKGDALLAFTDLKEFDVTYTTYDFDEEYNETEVIKTKKELSPEYVFVASIGNEKLRDKILKIYELSEMLIKKDGYYQYKAPRYGLFGSRNSSNVGNYVAIENDVLIVTNNEDLVKNKLKTGVSPSVRLSANRLSHLQKNNYAMFWDAEKTFSIFGEKGTDMPSEILEMFKVAGGSLGNTEISGLKKEGDLFTMSCSVKMKDETKPVVSELLNMMQQFYVINK